MLMSWETTSVECAIKQEVVQQLFRQDGRDGGGRAGKGKTSRLLRVNFTRYIGYAKRLALVMRGRVQMSVD